MFAVDFDFSDGVIFDFFKKFDLRHLNFGGVGFGNLGIVHG